MAKKKQKSKQSTPEKPSPTPRRIEVPREYFVELTTPISSGPQFLTPHLWVIDSKIEGALSICQRIGVHWETHQCLPELTDEEYSIVSAVYSHWINSKVSRSIIQDSQVFLYTLVALCANISRRVQHTSTFTEVVDTLESYLMAKEPIQSAALNFLIACHSPYFIMRDLKAMERLAASDMSMAVLLALVYECECNDPAKSLQLLHHVANKCDCPLATMILGARCLSTGEYARAYQWYMRSALANNPTAQHKIGTFYDEGLGDAVAVNITQAIKWYTEAGVLIVDSLHSLAKIHEDGRGIPVNTFGALCLHSIAGALGYMPSIVNLCKLLLLGYTNEYEELTQDCEAARRLLLRAAQPGDAEAQMIYGMIHATPAFNMLDLPVAEYWLRQAVHSGKTDADRMLRRVQQQLKQNNLSPIDRDYQEDILSAEAASQCGDDLRRHKLYLAAYFEYSTASTTDELNLWYTVRMVECVLASNLHAHVVLRFFEYLLNKSVIGVHDELQMLNNAPLERESNKEALKQLYDHVTSCLCECHRKSLRRSVVFMDELLPVHQRALMQKLVVGMLGRDAKATKCASYISMLIIHHKYYHTLFIHEGGMPIVLDLLSSISEEVEPYTELIYWCSLLILLKLLAYRGSVELFFMFGGMEVVLDVMRMCVGIHRYSHIFACVQLINNITAVGDDIWEKMTPYLPIAFDYALMSLQIIHTAVTAEYENVYSIQHELLQIVVACLTKIIHTAPSKTVLELAQSDILIKFQEIYDTYPNLPYELKSTIAYCVCKLFAAKDPKYFSVMQSNVTKKALKEFMEGSNKNYNHPKMVQMLQRFHNDSDFLNKILCEFIGGTSELLSDDSSSGNAMTMNG